MLRCAFFERADSASFSSFRKTPARATKLSRGGVYIDGRGGDAGGSGGGGAPAAAVVLERSRSSTLAGHTTIGERARSSGRDAVPSLYRREVHARRRVSQTHMHTRASTHLLPAAH